jgi:hypothetical protein
MPIGPGERYDFFLSRRGSVAAIAQEVADAIGRRAIPLDSERFRSTPRTCGRFRAILSLR